MVQLVICLHAIWDIATLLVHTLHTSSACHLTYNPISLSQILRRVYLRHPVFYDCEALIPKPCPVKGDFLRT